MGIIAAKVKIKTDRVEDFLKGAEELAAVIRKEKALKFQEIYRDTKAKDTFYFVEEWENDEAFKAHFEKEYCVKFGDLMAEITDGELEPFEWERVI